MAIKRKTLAASGDISLGDVGPDSIGTWVIHVSGTWTGSLVPQGYLAHSDLTISDAVSIGYKTAISSSIVDPGTTAITANGVYYIPADGLFVNLDWTRTTGSIVVDATPLDG